MSELKDGRGERLKGGVSNLIHKALDESSLTRIWFVAMAIGMYHS